MHLSTMTGKSEESALLESRTLYPKRTFQCLQFFYKMTGSSKDRLVIWVKMDDGAGTVRKMKKVHTFSGMHHVGAGSAWTTYLNTELCIKANLDLNVPKLRPLRAQSNKCCFKMTLKHRLYPTDLSSYINCFITRESSAGRSCKQLFLLVNPVSSIPKMYLLIIVLR